MRFFRYLGLPLLGAFLPACLPAADAPSSANTTAPAVFDSTLLPSANSTALLDLSSGSPPPSAANVTSPPASSAAAPSSTGDDSWANELPSPISPIRSQLSAGQKSSDSGIRRESHLIMADASSRAEGDVDTPEDAQLAAIAGQDHDFFKTLARDPKTWPEDERDRRAQAINDAYLKYLDDNLNDLHALILYGKFLRQVGERQQAYIIFQRAYRINPRVAVVNQELGNYLAEEGQYTPALGFFIQAIELAPNEPLYHYQLGELLNIFYDHYLDDKIYTEETLNKALTGEFARAAALDPSEPGYAWRYAESYYDILDPDWNAALAAWDALNQRTTSPVELEVIRLHRARVFIELGRFNDARPLLALPVRHVLEASRQELLQRLPENATPLPATTANISLTAPASSTAAPVLANITTSVSASSPSSAAPLPANAASNITVAPAIPSTTPAPPTATSSAPAAPPSSSSTSSPPVSPLPAPTVSPPSS